MLETITQRRYLIPFKASRIPQQFTDVLVIGGGVAGLRAAIASSQGGAETLVLCKDVVEECNTWYAQGGIAAVLDPRDNIQSHIQDTLRGGAGLCDQKAVRIVVTEGPQRVLELLKWGTAFDRSAEDVEKLSFGREGGHSFSRIVHAKGDATGRELMQTLIARARGIENLRISEKSFVIDILSEQNRCLGVLLLLDNQLRIIWAKQTILATGGAGQLYRETTNPRTATADGHAMAWRAGVMLKDMEMVQFHPTTLYLAGSSRALITEAVRGEGAFLVDRHGERFMPQYHPMAELAPRDIVSRAIVRQIRQTHFTHVFLDVRHLPTEAFRKRFPSLARLMDEFDLDLGKDLIPIHPAAHYMIGGVEADEMGRSSLAGLFAAGEAACSGLHGANRLGSNSLLEGLAFGARAGAEAARAAAEPVQFPLNLEHRIPPSARTQLDVVDVKSSLRSLMWRNVGIERDGERLAETREIIAFWARYVMDKTFEPAVDSASALSGWKLQNLLTVAALVSTAAYTRTESRGAHYRLDYPHRDESHWKIHQLWRRPMETALSSAVDESLGYSTDLGPEGK